MLTKSLISKHNNSSIEIKSRDRGSMKLSLGRTPKKKVFRKISSYILQKGKEIKNHQKELSVLLFQNNDVDLVRNLNPDKDNHLCDNKLFKENLINSIKTDENYDLHEPIMGQKVNLPKIKKITINGILDSDKKLNKNRKEAARNLANNILEKELYTNLKEIRNEYNDKKKKKKELYDNYIKITKKINSINLDLQIMEMKNTDGFLNKVIELQSKQCEIDRMQREKKQLEYRLNQQVINTMNSKIPNMMQGLIATNNTSGLNYINETTNKNAKLSKQNSGDKTEEKMKKMQSMFLAKKEQEEQKNEKIRQIKKYEDDLKEINIEINSLNKELSELKGKDIDLVDKLMKHYQALLFRGKDTRNEGLIWIIKSIWSLGKDVPMQFIPKFLDFNAIEFLFRLANKTIELENKKKNLNENKKNLNIKMHNLYHFNDNENKNDNNSISKKYFNDPSNIRSSFAFKTNLIKQNSVLRNSIKQSHFVKSYIHSNIDDDEEEHNKKEPNTFKEISMIMKKKNNNFDIGKISGMDDIENLQNKIKEIEKEIENMKNDEIKRIFKEYIANDYQNKYHAPVDVILAALLGEHTKNIEVNKFSKFKREYFDAIKHLRFYEYAKKNDSN